MSAKRMIIDGQLPVCDATIAEHRVVAADVLTTWRAARGLDFMTVRTPLLTASLWLRDLPDRLRGTQAPRPAQLRLDGGGAAGWLVLGEEEGSEIAFGAVGQLWQGRISWHDVPLGSFKTFSETGYGKIACNFTLREYGPDRTLLSCECRIAITDPVSGRKFARYWRVLRPFAGHVMRATLATAAADAEYAFAARPTARAGRGASGRGASAG